jgi:hypothetical protein
MATDKHVAQFDTVLDRVVGQAQKGHGGFHVLSRPSNTEITGGGLAAPIVHRQYVPPRAADLLCQIEILFVAR